MEDHATLLCSLFLGLGLDAYVAVGTRLDGQGSEADFAWVVTREQRVGAVAGFDVAFWDPLTGLRETPGGTSASGHRYARVHCLFNDARYYANHRLDDRVEAAGWDLRDLAAWKAVSAALQGASAYAP